MSKATLVVAGALCVASVAPATAATWASGASAHAGAAGLRARHPATAGPRARHPAAAASLLRLTITDRPVSVPLAQRAYQVRAVRLRSAVATRTGTHKRARATSAPSGSPQHIARAMLRSFGWSSRQFACLDPLWAHESGWSVTAENPSGAYGIPQALPGGKMASAGPDWQTSATTQIKWGLRYVKRTYGSPCAAWDHEQATGWY